MSLRRTRGNRDACGSTGVRAAGVGGKGKRNTNRASVTDGTWEGGSGDKETQIRWERAERQTRQRRVGYKSSETARGGNGGAETKRSLETLRVANPREEHARGLCCVLTCELA